MLMEAIVLKTLDSTRHINESVKKYLKENSEMDIFQDLMRVASVVAGDTSVPWNVVKKFADELSFMFGAIKWRNSLTDIEFVCFDNDDVKDDFINIWKCSLSTSIKSMDVRNIPLDKQSVFFIKAMENQLFNRTLNYFEMYCLTNEAASAHHQNFLLSHIDKKSL